MSNVLLHTFKVDVTPPIGDYLCGGLHDISRDKETDLFLRGIVLTSGESRHVIGVVDYCYLAGKSQQRLLEALAAGAEVPVERATLQSNHVHDAPLIDEEGARALVDRYPQIYNEEYFAGVIEKTRKAVGAALRDPGRVVAEVSISHHEVEKFASSRRVVGEDGQIHIRWSRCSNEEVRNAPEGRIDPVLDQIVLYGEGMEGATGEPLVALSFYACHPQVSDGRGIISADTVGRALNLFEEKNSGVFALYFTGCAGDITAGKYTSTVNLEENQRVFGDRLFAGMQGAFEKAKGARQPLENIAWADFTFDLPLRPIPETEEHYRAIVEDEAEFVGSKYLASMKLDRLRRHLESYPFRTSCLHLNDLRIVFLPSELVIHYQLYAKALRPGKVAVSAYGDSFLKYVAHDAAFDEGGYEVDPNWSEVDQGIEMPICRSIDLVINGTC